MGATFTFVNRCDHTVWPDILANVGSPTLDTTGFELPKDTSRSFQAPIGWSGRFWGRTGCNFDGSGSNSYLTSDCSSGHIECNGVGVAPPVTLAEFTLGTVGQDFYDVGLVDGYNLSMIVEGADWLGLCASTGCMADLSQQCPTELKSGDGSVCKSACEAFGSPEYCCNSTYSSPGTCRPAVYSEMFKSACPTSYSYAYDDASSTFTCVGADYTLTFCPSSLSQKSSRVTSPMTSTTSQQGSGIGSGGMQGSTVAGTSLGYSIDGDGSGSGSGEAILADGSYLAGLAMGDSSRTYSFTAVLVYSVSFLLVLSFM